MLPNIVFHLGQNLLAIPTNNFLILIAIAFAVMILGHRHSEPRRFTKAFALVLLTAVFALLGARLMHVVWERPDLLKSPALIFTRWDGMVFYGGLAMGLMAFGLGVRFFESSVEKRRHQWDLAGIAISTNYGILRLGCFASGCCWGRLTSVPWAVRYTDPHSVMPALGMPVHPVQLYDSLFGFMIGAALVVLNYRAWSQTDGRHWRLLRGKLIWVFFGLYGLTRFFTESFRGDSIRRTDLALSLSTSQWISAVLVIISAGILMRVFRTNGIKFLRALLFASFFALPGCQWIEPPPASWFSKHEVIRPGLEIYTSNHSVFTLGEKAHRRGNVIFLTADTYLFQTLSPRLKTQVKGIELPNIDELTWWAEARYLAEMYDHILLIRVDEAKHQTVLDALRWAESKGEPYDAYFLSHGFPNHLSSGSGYFWSYQELNHLKGQLRHLQLVFMQSCYGSTLAQDWLQAGAKSVVSFKGLNRNFFFITFFLRWFRYYDAPEAHQLTIRNMSDSMAIDPFYQGLLKSFGTTPEEYLKGAENPVITPE